MYLRVAVSGHLKQLLLRPLGLRCLMLMWQVQRQLQMRRMQQRLLDLLDLSRLDAHMLLPD